MTHIIRPVEWVVQAILFMAAGLAVAIPMGCSGGSSGSGTSGTVTITGQTGAEGVVLSYTDGGAKTVTTGASGRYTLTVPVNWTGTVTPSRDGSTFTPDKRSYQNLASSQADQDFAVVVRRVTGTLDQTYATFNAATKMIEKETVRDEGPSDYVKAILDDGTTLTGTYDKTTGKFAIQNVPSGYYWLKKGTYLHVRTDKDVLEVGNLYCNKKQIDYPSVSTSVTFALGGLNPWQVDRDSLIFHDFNSDFFQAIEGDTAIDANQTNLSVSLDWNELGYPLIDTGKGDSPRLVQMVGSTIGGVEVAIAKKLYAPASLSIQDGSGATITGTLQNLPLTDLITANFKRSEFTAYRAQYNPHALGEATFFVFASVPGISTFGLFGSNLLERFTCTSSTETADFNFPTMVPAPWPGWEAIAYGVDRHRVAWLHPSASSPYSMKGRMLTSSAVLPTASVPLRPVLSPIRNPKINGTLSLFEDQSGVGTTPILTWSLPDLGTPQGYQVVIFRLNEASGTTGVLDVAKLFLPGTETSLKIPAGILQAGQSYGIQIRAISDSSWDVTRHPYPANGASSGLFGMAEALSGRIQP